MAVKTDWLRTDIGNGGYRTIVPLGYAQMLDRGGLKYGTLLIQSGLVFEPFDMIEIDGVEVEVVSAKHARGVFQNGEWASEWGPYNWMINVFGESVSELREKMTFEN